jgi:hypothetical protein
MKFKTFAMLALAVGLLALTISSQAQQACSPQTTVGRYVLVCDGLLSPGPNIPLLPAKGLGAVVADDSGFFTGGATLNVGGTVLQQEVSGQEHLNADCTGTITYTQKIFGQPAPDLHIAFIVADHGDTIDGLVVDPNAVFSCKLRRSTKAVTDK